MVIFLLSMVYTIYEVTLIRELQDISEVRLGYQPKPTFKPSMDGSFRLIQIKDFDKNRNLDVSGMVKFKPDRDLTSLALSSGDVLFLARGQRNWSVSIDTIIDNVVAVAYFFVLRPITDDLMSAYLAWYLNQPPAKAYLTQHARRGSHMPVVPKSALINLPIDLPPVSTQKQIVELNRLAQSERHLVSKIGEKRTNLVQTISLQAIKRDSK